MEGIQFCRAPSPASLPVAGIPAVCWRTDKGARLILAYPLVKSFDPYILKTNIKEAHYGSEFVVALSKTGEIWAAGETLKEKWDKEAPIVFRLDTGRGQ